MRLSCRVLHRRTSVTNAEFAAFVKATGYRTEAEEYGISAVFHLAVAAGRGAT